MKRLSISSALVCLQMQFALWMSLPANAQENYGLTPSRISAEALFLVRSQNDSTVLAIDESNGRQPVLSGSDISFPAIAGPRFAIGWNFEEERAFELVYFGLHDWTSSAITFGSNNRSLPGDLGLATFDFFAADAIQATYGSKIHNVEANISKRVDSLEVLAGFRFLGCTMT
jgi:hypothetical protein